MSAASSFSVASCVLHPQLLEQARLAPILEQLGVRPPAYEPALAHDGTYVQTGFAACPQFFPQGGMPMVPAATGLRELCFDAFAILHSGNAKTPVFVAQRLNRRMLQQARYISRTDRFFAEARLPAAERAELEDYRNSGYSRGHMAPAADMHTAEAMAQSFSLANMAPQDQRHNAGAWNVIENDTRKYIMRARGDVHVFTGAAYSGQAQTQTIGPGRVAVPSHLFKLVYDTYTGKSWVHWQANSPDARPGPPMDYASFVNLTGLRLLPGM